jgi:murein L,D-transpeptidase YcbB/YkuD
MSYGTNHAKLRAGAAGKALFAATAVVGLGLFLYSALASQAGDKDVRAEIMQLRQQVEAITAERDQLARENNRRIVAGQSLTDIQVRIEAATGELRQLDEMRAGVSQAIEKARLELTGPTRQRAALEDGPATTSSVPLSKAAIRAAQEALVDFGYGKFEADGVLGPTTRKAVEAFERAKGLPVTGRLGAMTMQALKTNTASATE